MLLHMSGRDLKTLKPNILMKMFELFIRPFVVFFFPEHIYDVIKWSLNMAF